MNSTVPKRALWSLQALGQTASPQTLPLCCQTQRLLQILPGMGSVLLVQLLALLKQASPPGPAALLWLTQGKQTQLLGDWDRVRLIPSCTCTRAGLPTCISVFGLHVKGRSQY